MKFPIISILIAMLCACGAFPQPQTGKQILSKTAAKWVGRTVDELIVENGEPTNVEALDAGVRVFEYGKLEVGQTKTSKRTKKYVRGITFSDSGQLQQDQSDIVQRERSRRVKTKAPGQPCTILFTVSASDIVEKWSVEGSEDCRN